MWTRRSPALGGAIGVAIHHFAMDDLAAPGASRSRRCLEHRRDGKGLDGEHLRLM